MGIRRTTNTHFVYRLIPPRPTFDEDMTDAEREIMGRRAVLGGTDAGHHRPSLSRSRLAPVGLRSNLKRRWTRWHSSTT